MTLKYSWRSFQPRLSFPRPFQHPWYAFTSHSPPAIAELLVVYVSTEMDMGRFHPWVLSDRVRSRVTPTFSVIFLAVFSILAAVTERWIRIRNLYCHHFYQRVSIASYASAGIATAEMSVCPSVHPSHSGIVSKRRKLASWFLHHPRAWTF